MLTRRTVRHFSNEPVPHDLNDEAIAIAGSAPSGANLQPWQFVVVRDPDVKRQIRVAAEEEERAFYDALVVSGLDWTLVCTPNITPGDVHAPLVATANVLPPGTFQVTTGAVAAFLLREAADGRFLRSRVGINGFAPS